jgi:hypothetical protein
MLEFTFTEEINNGNVYQVLKAWQEAVHGKYSNNSFKVTNRIFKYYKRLFQSYGFRNIKISNDRSKLKFDCTIYDHEIKGLDVFSQISAGLESKEILCKEVLFTYGKEKLQ